MSISSVTGVNNLHNSTRPTSEKSEDTMPNWRSIVYAGGAYLASNTIGGMLATKVSSGMSGEIMKLSDACKVTKNEAKQIFKLSNLKKQGVRIRNCNLTKKIKSYTEAQAATGHNAFYVPEVKKILCNLNSSAIFAPHEMGHAKNYMSKNIFIKALAKSRNLGILYLPILAVALFRKPKKEGEESNTIMGKTLDYVKENSVGLAAATFAPTLIEEGLASIRGANLAKKVLSPEKLKAMKMINAKGWLSYAILEGFAVFATWAVNKIRELSVPKDENIAKINPETTASKEIIA